MGQESTTTQERFKCNERKREKKIHSKGQTFFGYHINQSLFTPSEEHFSFFPLNDLQLTGSACSQHAPAASIMGSIIFLAFCPQYYIDLVLFLPSGEPCSFHSLLSTKFKVRSTLKLSGCTISLESIIYMCVR